MPIINQTVKGGGTTPTGTKSITTNGVHDVTNYASADVQVPTTAPAHYLELNVVQENGETVMKNGAINPLNLNNVETVDIRLNYAFYGSLLNGPACINTSSVKRFKSYALSTAFMASTCTSTGLDFANVVLENGVGGSSAGPLESCFKSCLDLTSTGLENVEHMVFDTDAPQQTLTNNTLYFQGGHGLQNTFDSCKNLTTTGLNNLKTVERKGTLVDKCLNYTFSECSGLTTTGLGNLETVTDTYTPSTTSNSRSLFFYTFYKCTGLTTTGLSNLKTITSGWPAFNYMFSYCTGLTTTGIDWANLTITSNCYASSSASTNIFYYTFNHCTGLTTTGWSGMTTVPTGCFCDTFNECENITSIEAEDIVNIERYGLRFCFEKCYGLTTVSFSSLEKVENYGLYSTFSSCSNLATIYFPSIKSNSVYTNSFKNMVVNITGCTVHFPANLQSVITNPSMSGTNTVILFDLPSTYTLTGADTKDYYRNPKYDTVSALAWFDTSATRATPYYTNGTSDPQIGDTIYSDSSCTTVVTTISSIA